MCPIYETTFVCGHICNITVDCIYATDPLSIELSGPCKHRNPAGRRTSDEKCPYCKDKEAKKKKVGWFS
jgi:hypothetical protein